MNFLIFNFCASILGIKKFKKMEWVRKLSEESFRLNYYALNTCLGDTVDNELEISFTAL